MLMKHGVALIISGSGCEDTVYLLSSSSRAHTHELTNEAELAAAHDLNVAGIIISTLLTAGAKACVH